MAFPRNWIVLAGAAFIAGTSGCASTSSTPEGEAAAQLREREARISALEREVSQRNSRIESLSGELATTQRAARTSASARGTSPMPGGGDLLPPAKPGECYARVFVPPKFETRSDKVLRQEAGTRLETIPAQYETVTERVLVREASSKLVTVPATYKTVTEKVLVEPARSFWTLGSGSKASEADATLVAEASKLGLDLAAAGGSGSGAGAGSRAGAGGCFEERLVPAKFETQSERVITADASSRIEVSPAKYQMVAERVLVREASTRIEQIPAVYETVTERVLVRPATTEWKKGRGPVERVDDATGEIMCLVEVPAEYKTVTKRVLKTPGSTRTVEIPAEYKTVQVRRMIEQPQQRSIEIPAEYSTVTKRIQVSDARRLWVPAGQGGEGRATGRKLCARGVSARYKTVTRRVIDQPASTKTVAIPAEYETIKVTKLKKPATTRTIDIPAEYATVTKRVQVSDGQAAWREILCETNTTPGLVRKMQSALKQAGYNPGPVDGVVGGQTLQAIRGYQRAKGLPTGGVTMTTLKSLGVL